MAHTIFGTFKYESHEDLLKILPSFMAHRDRCLANESGTIQFDISLPNDDDTTIMLYEVYDNEDAFQAHRNGKSMQKIRAELEALGVKASLQTRLSCAAPWPSRGLCVIKRRFSEAY